MALYTRYTFVNRTENHIIGEEPSFEEAFTDNRGRLFRSCQKEFGRCTSKMYRDVTGGPPAVVGWVFEGKDTYQGCPRSSTYTREVWVEVLERPDKEREDYVP
jgi:hypothetical protein